MKALDDISKELKQEARARRKKMKEIKTMAAKKRLPKMKTWERKMFVKGAPCEKGETTEKTGCTPKGESKAGGGAPTKAEPAKKPTVTKAGTAEKEERKEEKKSEWGSLGKDDPKEIKKREQKKKEAAEKKAKKKKETPKLDTMKDVDEYLKKGEGKKEEKEKKGIVEKAKVAGKKLGKVFMPKGGGKNIRWTGKIWTDGDAVYGGTRTSGPMHGKTGQRIGKKTR